MAKKHSSKKRTRVLGKRVWIKNWHAFNPKEEFPIVNTFQKMLWTSLSTAIIIKWILTIICSHYLENPEPQWAYYGNEEHRQGMGLRLRGPSKASGSVGDQIQQMEPRMTFCERKEPGMGEKLGQQSGGNIKCRWGSFIGILLVTVPSIIC